MFKYAIALTIGVFVLAYAMENTPAKDSPITVTKPNIPLARDMSLPDDSGRRRVDTVDSVVPREESSTPIKQTAREFDSLAKPIGIWVGNLDTAGIAPWEQIRWEAIDSITKTGYWLMLDSHFVFKDFNCFKWYGKLGVTPDVPDTLWVVDTCVVPCRYERTIPLGCWTITKETTTLTDTVLVCDTICVQTIPVASRLHYYAWGDIAFQELRLFTSCNLPAQSPDDFLFVKYNNRWYQPLNDGYRPFGPAQDSCYINMYQWTYFVYMTTQPFSTWRGLGPWEVDSTVMVTATIPVSCELIGRPGVTRQITNCRNEERTTDVVIETRVWVDAGRDTTIIDDSCDCYIPTFVCSTALDSNRFVKYIYEYVYDTIKDICLQSYLIPEVEAKSDFADISHCLWDPEYLYTGVTYAEWLAFTNGLIALGSKTPDNTKIHVTAVLSGSLVVGYCWSCVPNATPGPIQDFWITEADLHSIIPNDAFRCKWTTTCEIVEVNRGNWQSYVNWCCSKDTTISVPCEDEYGMIGTIVANYTYLVPNMDVPCADSIVIDITKTDSVLVDSLVWWVVTPRTEYILSWEDTCCTDPTFNGEEWPCDFWLINDCGPQLYKDSQGRWHIPCPTSETAGERDPDVDGDGWYEYTDYDYIKNVVQEIYRKQDSIRLATFDTIHVLQDTVFRHTRKLDSMMQSIDTLYRWNDAVQSAGRVYGGLITANGDGTVSVKAGLGWIKEIDAELSTLPLDCGDCATDSSSAMISKIIEVPWDSVASLALTDSAYNFIYFDGSDSTIKATTDFYSISFYRDFTLGRAYRMGTQVVSRLCGTNVWSFDRRVQQAGEELFPVVRAKGINVSEGSFRTLNVTSGIIWAELVNRFTTAAKNTRTDSLTYWYRSGTGWASYKAIAIDSLRYDNGTGTLATLTVNRYGDHWIYAVHDGSVHVVYGRGDYTLINAQAATQPATLPGLLSSYATLRAKIIIQRGSGTFYSIESPDDVRFTTTGVTDHSELSGLQGGTAGQYYHLTSTLYNKIGVDSTKITAGANITLVGNVIDGFTISSTSSGGGTGLQALQGLSKQAITFKDTVSGLVFVGVQHDSTIQVHLKIDTVLAYRRDTSSGSFWNWSQAGLVITDTASLKGILGFDTTKLQGLPEVDPIWTVAKTSYPTFSSIFSTQDSLKKSYDSLTALRLAVDSMHVKDTTTNTWYNWSQAGIIITDTSKLQGILGFDTTKLQGLPESDPLAVRKADSSLYSSGYITYKRLSDSLNANPRVGLDTSGLGFWNWSQSGTVITDTSKLQGILGFDTTKFRGLLEEDPIWNTQKTNYILKIDSNGIATNYITLSKLRVEVKDSLQHYARISNLPDLTGYRLKSDTTKPGGTATWTLLRGEIKDSLTSIVRVESDPLSVKKADSSSYSLGYMTVKRFSDSLNVNPRVGLDTSAGAFWSWSQAGVVITDTSKLQGIIGYDTSKVKGIVDLNRAYLDTSSGAFWNWNQSADPIVADSITKLRLAIDSIHIQDTVASTWYSWVQAGVIITDTSKLQGLLGFDTTKFIGLPEADPVWNTQKTSYVLKADSNNITTNYVTLSKLRVETKDSLQYYARLSNLPTLTSYRLKADTTKPEGTVTWTQMRVEVKDSLQYYARLSNLPTLTDYRLKSDTTKPDGTVTWTQLRVEVKDSLGVMVRTEVDPVWTTQKTGYFAKSDSTIIATTRLPKADSNGVATNYMTLTATRNEIISLLGGYVRKSDSASYPVGYITPKALSDTLNNNPRGAVAGLTYTTTSSLAPSLNPDTYDVFFLAGTDNAVTADLGDASTDGQVVTIKCTNATNAVKFSSTTGIDGSVGEITMTVNKSYRLMWVTGGTGWRIISSH